MAEYLNEKAKFKCACGMQPLFFTCKEGKNSKVTCGGSKVLTVQAKLQKPAGLQCSFLTATVPPIGTPKPCQLIQTAWMPFEVLHTAEGANLLLNNSKNICGITPTGIIEVFTTGTNGKFIKGSGPSKVDVNVKSEGPQQAQPNKNINNADVPKDDSKSEAAPPSKSEKSSPPSPTTQAPLTAATTTPAKRNDNSKSNIIKTSDIKYKCSECKWQNGGCIYRHEEDPKKISRNVNKDNAALKESHKFQMMYNDVLNKVDEADVAYERSLNRAKSQWTHAHHHIICANQAFGARPNIVKLANAAGYDINCAENCIMLATTNGVLGAREVMDKSKIQWHVGGHSYTFSEAELETLKKNIKRYKGLEVAAVKDYVDLVIDELKKIEYQYNGKLGSEKFCPAGFVSRMNNLSDKIRQKLVAFKNNPKDSYPYYVSKAAYLYAFNVI